MSGGVRPGAGRRPTGEVKRSEMLQVRLTPEEMAAVRETAAHHRLTVTDLVRKALGLAVFALVFLSGCCWQGYADIECDPPPRADEAQALVEAAYAARFGWHADAVVRWTREPMEVHGYEADGVSFDCADIWVYRYSDTPSETSLAHELAHCYAGEISHCGLHADNTHSNPAIWGDDGLVARTNAMLADRGL